MIPECQFSTCFFLQARQLMLDKEKETEQANGGVDSEAPAMLESQTKNMKSKTLNMESKTLNMESQTLNMESQTQNMGSQTRNMLSQTESQNSGDAQTQTVAEPQTLCVENSKDQKMLETIMELSHNENIIGESQRQHLVEPQAIHMLLLNHKKNFSWESVLCNPTSCKSIILITIRRETFEFNCIAFFTIFLKFAPNLRTNYHHLCCIATTCKDDF
jgi:hypothetical protein